MQLEKDSRYCGCKVRVADAKHFYPLTLGRSCNLPITLCTVEDVVHTGTYKSGTIVDASTCNCHTGMQQQLEQQQKRSTDPVHLKKRGCYSFLFPSFAMPCDKEYTPDLEGDSASRNANATRSGDEKDKRKRGRKEPVPSGNDDEIVWEMPDKKNYQGIQVNWTTLASRRWAKESLLRNIPHEVSGLIGWAHHGTHSNGAEKQDELPFASSEPNPLLEVEPASPLPHSHLDYLQELGRDLVRGKPENPNISKAKVMDKSLECILDSFDTSASVAVGMLLEEMITANLLPLAEAHVRRCRQLEEGEANLEQRLKTEKYYLTSIHDNQSFREWTLPPEEAIFNVVVSSLSSKAIAWDKKKGLGCVPSNCPPSRAGRTTLHDDGSSLESDPRQQAASSFCRRQGLKSRFVRKNMDIYQWLLAMTPIEGDDGPKLRRKPSKKAKR